MTTRWFDADSDIGEGVMSEVEGNQAAETTADQSDRQAPKDRTPDEIVASFADATDARACNKAFSLYQEGVAVIRSGALNVTSGELPDTVEKHIEALRSIAKSAESLSRMAALTARLPYNDFDQELSNQIQAAYSVAKRDHQSNLVTAFSMGGSVSLYTYLVSLVRSARYGDVVHAISGGSYEDSGQSGARNEILYTISGWSYQQSTMFENFRRNQSVVSYPHEVRKQALSFLADIEPDESAAAQHADTLDAILALTHYVRDYQYQIDNPDTVGHSQLAIPRFVGVQGHDRGDRIKALAAFKDDLLGGGLLDGDGKRFDRALKQLSERLQGHHFFR